METTTHMQVNTRTIIHNYYAIHEYDDIYIHVRTTLWQHCDNFVSEGIAATL